MQNVNQYEGLRVLCRNWFVVNVLVPRIIQKIKKPCLIMRNIYPIMIKLDQNKTVL